MHLVGATITKDEVRFSVQELEALDYCRRVGLATSEEEIAENTKLSTTEAAWFVEKCIEGGVLNMEYPDEGTANVLMALIMHAGWVGYQIGVGQDYNLNPSEGQMQSLLDAIKHRQEAVELTPEGEHKNWMDFKLSTGWKYGPVKDEAAKTHPDLLPWDELPEVEQRKDVQSIAAYEIAKQALRAIGVKR